MMKFRKKPVVIEAVQWKGENWDELEKFCPYGLTQLTRNGLISISVDTLEGELHATVGDWIIKGIKGEFYPCKPDIFEATYERVGE
jgi:hypothetical protein